MMSVTPISLLFPPHQREGITQVVVEALQHPRSTVSRRNLTDSVSDFVRQQGRVRLPWRCAQFPEDCELSNHVTSLYADFEDSRLAGDPAVDLSDKQNAKLRTFVYQLHDEGPSQEGLEHDQEWVQSANHWTLPATEFQGLWDSLVLMPGVKEQLLAYAETALRFADAGVNPVLVPLNRIILLYGPPGTGKTSMCKALAQKLCIRLCHRYSYGQFIEINSHSLFSKWFSESGKLVQKMFNKVTEWTEDNTSLVCVLIDEVESLTAARKAALSGTEPSDAIRVVNALLTQLDHLRRASNVLILTTSNITEAIDGAFIDRADLKLHIGPPSPQAAYAILGSCLEELMRTGVVSPRQQIFSYRSLVAMDFAENSATRLSVRLWSAVSHFPNVSGRTLRKLPFLACAAAVTKNAAIDSLCSEVAIDSLSFVDGLVVAAKWHLEEEGKLTATTNKPVSVFSNGDAM